MGRRRRSVAEHHSLTVRSQLRRSRPTRVTEQRRSSRGSHDATRGGHCSSALAAFGYALLPSGPFRDGAFAVLGLVCAAVAYAGLRRHPPARRSAWLLILAGFLGWVLGDALFSLQVASGWTAYPAPADAVYVVSYVLMALGVARSVPRRRDGELSALLDAAVVATGVFVVAATFVLVPIWEDSSLGLLGKLTSAFYPVADVLLLATLVRSWTVMRVRGSLRLVMAALAMILVGDIYYTTTTSITGRASPRSSRTTWSGTPGTS